MMVHVEVKSTAVRENSVERIPLDTDVVYKFCFHIEMRHKIFSTVADIDSVMTIKVSSFRADYSGRTRS